MPRIKNLLPPNAKFSRSHEKQENKTCTNCGSVFPSTTEFFTRKSASWDNLHQECKICINKRAKKRRDTCWDKVRQYDIAYKNSHKKERNDYQRNKRKSDIVFSLNGRVSTSINKCLSSGKQGWSWGNLVNYTIGDLKSHLESLFMPGMTWENRSKWHIDHIRPISSFNFKSHEDEEFKECWALKNLRPLWAKENIAKHNKWDPKKEVNF